MPRRYEQCHACGARYPAHGWVTRRRPPLALSRARAPNCDALSDWCAGDTEHRPTGESRVEEGGGRPADRAADRSEDAGGDRRGSVGGGERVDRLVGVQAARVRDHPQLGALERLGLPAEHGASRAERRPVRA